MSEEEHAVDTKQMDSDNPPENDAAPVRDESVDYKDGLDSLLNGDSGQVKTEEIVTSLVHMLK